MAGRTKKGRFEHAGYVNWERQKKGEQGGASQIVVHQERDESGLSWGFLSSFLWLQKGGEK